MSHFIEISVDDEIVELEISAGNIYHRCPNCGKKVYGPWLLEYELEQFPKQWEANPYAYWCQECTEEEQKRTAPLRLAEYISNTLSIQCGKDLPVETALQWIRTDNSEYIKQRISEFRKESIKQPSPAKHKQVVPCVGKRNPICAAL